MGLEKAEVTVLTPTLQLGCRANTITTGICCFFTMHLEQAVFEVCVEKGILARVQSESPPTPVGYVNQMCKPIVFGRHRVLGDHLVTYSYTGVGNILTQALQTCLPMLAIFEKLAW